MHWFFFGLGILVGANIGLIVFALCSIAKDSDARADVMERSNEDR